MTNDARTVLVLLSKIPGSLFCPETRTPEPRNPTMSTTLDLSLQNAALYHGCTIERSGGQLTLTTAPEEAINLVGENVNRIISNLPSHERDVCVLTGRMAIWAYLAVFHAVVHTFREVRYHDGHGEIVVARHVRAGQGGTP